MLDKDVVLAIHHGSSAFIALLAGVCVPRPQRCSLGSVPRQAADDIVSCVLCALVPATFATRING